MRGQQKIARFENQARKSGDFAFAPAGTRAPSAAVSAVRSAAAAAMGSAMASAAGSGSAMTAAADLSGLQASVLKLELHACHLPLSFIAVYETSPGFDRDKRCLKRQKGQITARIRGFAVSVGQPSVSGSDRSSYK